MRPIEVMRRIRRQIARAQCEELKFKERVLAGAKLIGVEVQLYPSEASCVARLQAPGGWMFTELYGHDFHNLVYPKTWKDAQSRMGSLQKRTPKWAPPQAMLRKKAIQQAVMTPPAWGKMIP